MSVNKQEYEKIYLCMYLAAYFIIAVNVYYYAHPWFDQMGLSHPIVKQSLLSLRKSGLFDSSFMLKLVAYLLLLMSHIVRSGKGKNNSWILIISVLVIGTGLYFFFPKDYALYIASTITGAGLCVWSFAMIGRNLHGLNKDVNDDKETFDQCTDLIETDDSINIPIKFQYKKKIRNGWINIVAPFRSCLICGTPGSGKSFSIYNPIIKQSISKGYACFCYDFKFPDLTEIVYNEALRTYPPIKDKKTDRFIPDPTAPEFIVINFNDPRYSNRCNPLSAKYIRDFVDATEKADVIMKNVSPGMVEKQDFFSMSATLHLANIIMFLKIVKDGIYCSFPYVIELMAQDYKKVFAIMSGFKELETSIKPFASALEAGAQDQLQGQIASAQIPLNKMASPALYWVLSGDDFTLDINNPEHPKILCLGNDPDRQGILGTASALITSTMFKTINHKHKRKCIILLDELPTIFIKGLDNLIATARSNKVAIFMGVQDKTQLIRDYSEKEANVIFNTVGNIISGQVNGRTAEELNKSFGREKRLQESQTQNIDSESLSLSFHDEELMPIRKIETLTQGYFFGKIADNNSTPIEKKLFCGEVQIDPNFFPKKPEKKLPVMSDFGEAALRKEIEENAEDILYDWCETQLQNTGIMYDDDELEEKIKDKMESITDKQREAILKDEFEVRINEIVQEKVEENFMMIRQNVKELIEELLPDDYEDEEKDDEDEEEDLIDKMTSE